MILKNLTLTNYKSFSDKSIILDKNINCFVGANGVGKSNILDAIYHLSFGKSYFNPISSQNIKHKEDFFAIKGVYNNNLKNEIILIFTSILFIGIMISLISTFFASKKYLNLKTEKIY